MARALSIDYGLARIGLALSDENKIISSPLPTLKAAHHTHVTCEKLVEEINKHNIDEIVIGIPYHLNGKRGCQADEVYDFIAQLKEKTSIPIIPWDERLTSVQADRSMRNGKMTRKKRAQKVDSVAALIILQSYLDSKGHSLLGV